MCAFGLIEFAGPFWLIPLGERWISSSVTAILLAAVPLVMAPQSRLLGVYERLGPRRVLGLAIGFVGGLFPAVRAARIPVTAGLREP